MGASGVGCRSIIIHIEHILEGNDSRIHQVNYDEAKRRLGELIDAAVRCEKVFIIYEDEKTVQFVPVD